MVHDLQLPLHLRDLILEKLGHWSVLEIRSKDKEAKKKKQAVAIAEVEAWGDWYDNMEMEEDERKIYRVAKQRAKIRQDLTKEV